MSINKNLCVALSANTAWYLYNFRAGLIRAMISQGWEVVAIAPEDRFFEHLRDMGCRTYNILIDNKGSNPIRDTITLCHYWSLFRRLKPDIVLEFTIKPVIYGTLISSLLRIPTINTITGLGTTYIRDTFLTKIVAELYRITQRWASVIVFQNETDHDYLIELGLVPAAISTRVSGSGVDLLHFKTTSLPPDQPRIFLLVGRLLWDKGIGEYVEAARRIKAVSPSVCFQVLGPLNVANRTAVTSDQLKNWEREGIVTYLGEADDVREYIAQAHCIVLPSYREGLPRSLIEGAAMGRPLVATDVSGCRDVIDDGLNGYLCNVRDVDDLTKKLTRVCSLSLEELSDMGKKGRKKVETEFDESVVIGQYIHLIRKSLAI